MSLAAMIKEALPIFLGWALGLVLGFCLWWHPGTDAVKAFNAPVHVAKCPGAAIHFQLYEADGTKNGHLLNEYDQCWP